MAKAKTYPLGLNFICLVSQNTSRQVIGNGINQAIVLTILSIGLPNLKSPEMLIFSIARSSGKALVKSFHAVSGFISMVA
jgi:hypothetical protein